MGDFVAKPVWRVGISLDRCLSRAHNGWAWFICAPAKLMRVIKWECGEGRSK